MPSIIRLNSLLFGGLTKYLIIVLLLNSSILHRLGSNAQNLTTSFQASPSTTTLGFVTTPASDVPTPVQTAIYIPPVINYTDNPTEFNPTSIHHLDPVGSGVIYVLGTITCFANIFGSTAIIVLTWRNSKSRLEPLSPSRRFPLYMAFFDLSIALVIIPNLLYAMINDHLLPGGWCMGVGFTTSTLLCMNMLLMAIIAIITYYRVCHGKIISLGARDIYLFTMVITISLIVSLITHFLHGYGPDTYWCFTNREASGSRVNMIVMTTFAYLVAAVTTFCYLKVIKRIHGVEAMLTTVAFKRNMKAASRPKSSTLTESDGKFWARRSQSMSQITAINSISQMTSTTQSPLSPRSSYSFPAISSRASVYSSVAGITRPISPDGLTLRPPTAFLNLDSNTAPTPSQQRMAASIARATRKMSAYIFLQLMQYTPLIIYCLCLLVGENSAWIYVITITFLNLGAMAKTIVFLRHETTKISSSIRDNDDDEKVPPPRHSTYKQGSFMNSSQRFSHQYSGSVYQSFPEGRHSSTRQLVLMEDGTLKNNDEVNSGLLQSHREGDYGESEVQMEGFEGETKKEETEIRKKAKERLSNIISPTSVLFSEPPPLNIEKPRFSIPIPKLAEVKILSEPLSEPSSPWAMAPTNRIAMDPQIDPSDKLDDKH